MAMKKLGHNIKPDWLEKMEEMIDTEGKERDFLEKKRKLQDGTSESRSNARGKPSLAQMADISAKFHLFCPGKHTKPSRTT